MQIQPKEWEEIFPNYMFDKEIEVRTITAQIFKIMKICEYVNRHFLGNNTQMTNST